MHWIEVWFMTAHSFDGRWPLGAKRLRYGGARADPRDEETHTLRS